MLTFDCTFSEMREKWLTAFSGKESEVFETQANRNRYAKLRGDWIRNPDFYGENPANMVGYFSEGYFVDALENIDVSAMPVRKRKRPRYNDCEGEFRFDLFEVGDENYFCDWTRREAIPGITVEFATGFLANVPSKTIADYMRWICQALIAIETAGIDAAIYATSTGDNRFTSSESLKWRMEVKREGERNDFTNWSALFSPGSYRQLGFFTLIMAANKLGRTINNSFGASRSKGWDVVWNSETRTLEISHVSNQNAGFPEREMTEALIAALANARGN